MNGFLVVIVIRCYEWLYVSYSYEKTWIESIGMIIHSQLIWNVIKFHDSKPPTSDYTPLLTIINHH